MKLNKGNLVAMLDRKLYNSAIEEIVSDTSKFEKLNEDPTLNRKASLQRFLHKLKQTSTKFNMINCIHLVLLLLVSMHKFSSSDSFPKLCSIISSIGNFNNNLAHFLCDLLSPLVPND